MKPGPKPYSVNENYLNHLTHEKAWFLGLMAADGNVANDRRFSLWQAKRKGYLLLSHVKKILKFEGPIIRVKGNGRKTHIYVLSITSPKLVQKLKKYNIVPRKSLILKFPSMPIRFIKSFLRGFIDGDGSIQIGTFRNNCKRLLASYVGPESFLIDSLKYVPVQAPKLQRKSNSPHVFQVRWTGKKAIEFCKWLFSNKKLYRYYKYETFMHYLTTRNDLYTTFEPLRKKAATLLKRGYSYSYIGRTLSVSTAIVSLWKKYGKI